MGVWLVPESELTPDQIRAVQLPTDGHKVVSGPPGSGKTLVLVHRARYLLDSKGITGGQLRLFVYTRTLRDYIQSALKLLGIADECVLTFDAWCRSFYLSCVGNPPPRDEVNGQLDFREIRRAVLRALETAPVAPVYDYVLVDEGHDLDEISYKILVRIARHITVCMDRKQQIYDDGAAEERVLHILGLPKRSVALLEAYRCCPYITRLAATLLDRQERQPYLGQMRTEQVEREKPLLFIANAQEAELHELARQIRERQRVQGRNDGGGGSIAILFPQKRMVFGYANALADLGVQVEVHLDRPAQQARYEMVDFRNNLPKILTYHQAKGLTFDSVFMPRLVGYAFKRVSEPRLRRLLFVGITRAKSWVYMSTEDSRMLPCLNAICDESGDFLAVRYSGGNDGPKPDTDSGEEDGLANLFT
ncbi:MAG TPA: 3'-5' exonuclease [candidate division Zixibacteria bacterium]|nr:AAA family ATPase [candidate division Zixibacteria bacterium]MDD4916660.1 3'-5' exonuclease [candidate division Zixibacteria bacterium]MDM7973218.1 3'-5' exonuclease [candidate division Zixibacteria bacterium]HOD66010.1 3'-5' exonuclease [candidate division Zixibacteria bacterium]HOZ07831.1 3'-5' exonuclease [candidate division Zixibacteria bacterium]